MLVLDLSCIILQSLSRTKLQKDDWIRNLRNHQLSTVSFAIHPQRPTIVDLQMEMETKSVYFSSTSNILTQNRCTERCLHKCLPGHLRAERKMERWKECFSRANIPLVLLSRPTRCSDALYERFCITIYNVTCISGCLKVQPCLCLQNKNQPGNYAWGRIMAH